MLTIKKDELINEDMVESICMYNSEPLTKLAGAARKNGNIREFRGRYGYKSMVIMEDGYLFLCPNNPAIYFARAREEDYLFLDPKRYAVRKKLVREVTTRPNKGQHQDIVKAKKEGRYINLARGKKTKCYVFMVTGRIYGAASIRNVPSGSEQEK